MGWYKQEVAMVISFDDTKKHTDATISVLIPARNGEGTLAELLKMLSLQTVAIDEIIVADSESTDNTVQIAMQYGAGIIKVKVAEFDHGGTRTLMAQKSKGDILIFLTQDAILQKKDSIERLIAPMLQDTTIATTYGRQVAAPNADFFARALRAFNYPDHSVTRDTRDIEKYGIKTAFTSNSFAGYRRSSLEEIGFFQDDLIFGEDTIAVAHLLEQGCKIAYVAEAVTCHSHNYTPMEEFKRYFDIGVLHERESWFLKKFGSAQGQGKCYMQYVFRMLLHEKKLHYVPEFVLRSLMKYCGYHFGLMHKRLPKLLIFQMSLHQSWWKK